MSNSVKKAIRKLLEDTVKTKSAMARLLNPNMDGAGSRVYPARNAKNDAKYGIRVDKGEAVHGQPNKLRLHLQVNSHVDSKSLQDLAKKDPHRVVSTADIDTSQSATEEGLKELEAQFEKNLKV
ncbi:hypothetical protein NX059_005047 [Plenodomus lindquistii]|nr:hypothetical protein NX059_005047 [Plenodomus lindquistii]